MLQCKIFVNFNLDVVWYRSFDIKRQSENCIAIIPGLSIFTYKTTDSKNDKLYTYNIAYSIQFYQICEIIIASLNTILRALIQIKLSVKSQKIIIAFVAFVKFWVYFISWNIRIPFKLILWEICIIVENL